MRWNVSPLEKTLRRSVRAEVRASPALWDAYRRRRTPWWRKALSIILALACLNFLPIGLVLMPVSLSFALAAPVIKPHFAVPDAALQGSRITMALAALFLTGWGLMVAAASNALNALGRQTSAWLDIKATGPAAFAFLPVRDRPHWFMPVRDLLLFGVCVIWLGLPAYAAVGWANQLSVLQWVAGALLLGLQPLMLAAALVLGTIAVPRFFSGPAAHIVGAGMACQHVRRTLAGASAACWRNARCAVVPDPAQRLGQCRN